MHWRWLCSLLAGMMLWHVAGLHAAESESPKQIVDHLIQAIRSIKVSSNGNLSAEDQAHNAAAGQTANAILDVARVSQRTLGRHWEERTPEERQAFISLLSQLFTKVAYPKSAEFFSGLDVSITDEQLKGSQALVLTTVKHPKEGLVSVDYQLQHEDDHWYIQDLLLDDVSLARNLQSQFNKIIQENSFDELLRRMRDKLAE